MEPAVRSGTADAPVAAAVDGVVSRRALFERLGAAGRVTDVSAPAGSGKTVLLRSWIGGGPGGRAAWVAVQGAERDPQPFWIAVADALRGTAAGIRAGAASNGGAGSGRLGDRRAAADGPGSAGGRIWLVVDDVHELAPTDALRPAGAAGDARARRSCGSCWPPVTIYGSGCTGCDWKGELTEIRAADLRFTLDEARALFDAAGVQLPESAVALLHARTEGWAAGLRLAALSLASAPRSGAVRRRVLRQRAHGGRVPARRGAGPAKRAGPAAAAAHLGARAGQRRAGRPADRGQRRGADPAGPGARPTRSWCSLDAQRSWFRYHQLFADLLQLELRRTEPGELPALHRAAAGWYAEHGYPVEAVRHAQAAEDWGLAARLLSEHWLSLRWTGSRTPRTSSWPDSRPASLRAIRNSPRWWRPTS